jgi:hypothetical protein
MMRCTFEIVRQTEQYILIRDTNGLVSVTNQADQVVEHFRSGIAGRRLFYYDSEGRLDELSIRDGRFDGFDSINPLNKTEIENNLPLTQH